MEQSTHAANETADLRQRPPGFLQRRYARLRYLHWDSAGTSEVGIVPADWLLPEPDQRSKRPCDLRQGDVGLTEAEQDGGSAMMLARVLRVEGSVLVCRFLPRRDSSTFEFTSGSWWPVQRFAPLRDGRSQYLCVPTKQLRATARCSQPTSCSSTTRTPAP